MGEKCKIAFPAYNEGNREGDVTLDTRAPTACSLARAGAPAVISFFALWFFGGALAAERTLELLKVFGRETDKDNAPPKYKAEDYDFSEANNLGIIYNPTNCA